MSSLGRSLGRALSQRCALGGCVSECVSPGSFAVFYKSKTKDERGRSRTVLTPHVASHLSTHGDRCPAAGAPSLLPRWLEGTLAVSRRWEALVTPTSTLHLCSEEHRAGVHWTQRPQSHHRLSPAPPFLPSSIQ